MTTLLVARQYIKTFISKYEVYLKPLMKQIGRASCRERV